ncbi:MAG: DNA-binding response regulator [Flavobacteriales bacterium]|jgi:two-component system LytT family response regulator|nr:DNA-binding response regulator [Flavobacteriales bacterium]
MPTAIIIDDSRKDREALKKMLEHHPDIVVEQECDSAAKGIKAIAKHRPDLVFLDVQMPEMNGLEMLAAIGRSSERDFAVIFITSFEEYAIQAIHMAALDYVLKPIDSPTLYGALDNFRKGIGNRVFGTQMEVVRHNLSITAGLLKIVSVAEHKLKLKHVAYCCTPAADGEGKGAYTSFYLSSPLVAGTTDANANRLVASKELKHYDTLFTPFGFIRVGRGYLINPEFVTKVGANEVTVTFSNGDTKVLETGSTKQLLHLLGPRLLK